MEESKSCWDRYARTVNPFINSAPLTADVDTNRLYPKIKRSEEKDPCQVGLLSRYNKYANIQCCPTKEDHSVYSNNFKTNQFRIPDLLQSNRLLANIVPNLMENFFELLRDITSFCNSNSILIPVTGFQNFVNHYCPQIQHSDLMRDYEYLQTAERTLNDQIKPYFPPLMDYLNPENLSWNDSRSIMEFFKNTHRCLNEVQLQNPSLHDNLLNWCSTDMAHLHKFKNLISDGRRSLVISPGGLEGRPPVNQIRGKHQGTEGRRDYRCQQCEKAYTTASALKMHTRTHTLPCRCKLCGKAFSRPWLLQGHLRTHTGEKPFICGQCGRAFADRSNLRAHIQTHYDIKQYNCNKCQKSFSRMSLLLKHQNRSCSPQVPVPLGS